VEVLHRGPGYAVISRSRGSFAACEDLRGLQDVLGGVLRPVGEWDNDVTGVQLLAGNDQIRKQLRVAWCHREFVHVYLALLVGTLPSSYIESRSSICIPSEEDEEMRLGGHVRQGNSACTAVLPRSYGALDGVEVTLCEVRPLAARRHQARLHCAGIGHPILGDALYSVERRLEGRIFSPGAEQLQLHSWTLQGSHFSVTTDDILSPLLGREPLTHSVLASTEVDVDTTLVEDAYDNTQRRTRKLKFPHIPVLPGSDIIEPEDSDAEPLVE